MSFIEEIKQIRESFLNFVHKTPLERSNTFSTMVNNQVYLKLENFQRTGSFKIRGAYNKISKLSDQEKKAGVITASAGNHGQAVALAAKLFNINATVVVPEGTPIVKVEAIKNYSGKVIESGIDYDQAYKKALEINKEEKLPFIHAFNDMDIIKGQATLGLEVVEDLPDVDYIFCPVGGGGLISGISSYCKEFNKDIKIIGVQSQNAPSLHESFKEKKLTISESQDTICDGIAVKHPGDKTFDFIQKYVDEIVLVSDEEVANAILLLMERAKTFAEGAGAAALAAVLNYKVPIKGKKVVVIISGGNLAPVLLDRIIHKGLIKEGRLLKFELELPDQPGSLAKVLKIIADLKGNIVTIIHDRARLDLKYKMTDVIIDIETRDKDHIDQILTEFKKSYDIRVLNF